MHEGLKPHLLWYFFVSLCLFERACGSSYHRTNGHSWSGLGSWRSAGRLDSASLGSWMHMTAWIPKQMTNVERWEVKNRKEEQNIKQRSRSHKSEKIAYSVPIPLKPFNNSHYNRYSIHIQGALIRFVSIHVNSEIIIICLAAALSIRLWP